MSLCINPSCADPQSSDDHLFCASCGSELLLEGRYRVLSLRGQGGFGKTYEVSDLDSSPKILKILTDNYPKHVELFQREANLLSQLSHPGIPKVEPNAYFTFYPRNWKEPLHCLVMEKIVGLDLQDYLRQRGHPIDEKLAVQWLKQVLKILQVVHTQQVLHRDIKPSNIMLKANGNICLVDFGTARSVTNVTNNQQGGTRVVSSFYTPREQIHGQAVPQSDFFALGRTFVHLVTGKELSQFYDGSTDNFEWRSTAINISPRFANLLDWLMSPIASQRPANAEVVLQQLIELESSGQFIPTSALNQALALESTQAVNLPSSNSNSNAFHPGSTSGPVSTGSQPLPSPSTSPPSPPTSPPSPHTGTGVPSSPIGPPSTAPESATTPILPNRESSIRPEFSQKCQNTLAEFIGPISTIVYQRTVTQHPDVTEQELVKLLSQHIPIPEQSTEFCQRLRS
ncbi:serine/threonine-protein kinase [Acaryochloris sp. IP29b_bin.148]|uniref:serine/threonine-protein kinase n=1 Tax=Acaryochloris sp. IP29b_bin.148 TaxID=2969218 RepID=UPI002603401C|nr:serine/threonine-protein kinase [Acaryochloris sp. IP29b_bin.148]